MATSTQRLANRDNARSMVRSHPRPCGRWLLTRAASLGCAAILLASLTACGTSFNELLFQSGSAVGRSALDRAITDLFNQLANSAQPMVDDGAGDTTGGDMSGGGTSGGDPGALTGDPVAGQATFMANGCGACHCDDASGGCALSAPSNIGADVATVDDHLRGTATHPVKPPVSDQDVADLAAWLGTL